MTGMKKAAALSTATLAMTAGALLGAVGSASAAPAHYGHDHDRGHCRQDGGHWSRLWIPGHWDHRHFERGHWELVRSHGDRDCDR
jgi:hypothetical protein